MPNIQITIIDVSAPQKIATAKGGYNAIEVAYKKDGKVEGKKILDFVNKEIWKKVQQMKVGETYDIELVKDKNDYWQWNGITPGGSGESAQGSAPSEGVSSGSSAASRPTSGRVTGSNYETPEERARRQVLIVRQSSLTAALNLLFHNQPKTEVDPLVALAMADEITKWVFKTDATAAVKDMQDDVPI